MRRMLDPKEVGGGSESLYLHSIYLSNRMSNAIMVQIYNHSSTQFTMDSFKQLLSNKRYPCSGAISTLKSGAKREYIPYYIQNFGKDSLACYSIDLANHNDLTVTTDTSNDYKLTDDVFPIK